MFLLDSRYTVGYIHHWEQTQKHQQQKLQQMNVGHIPKTILCSIKSHNIHMSYVF